MEMAHSKIRFAALLLCFTAFSAYAQEDVTTFGWRKVLMDNSRSVTAASDSGCAASVKKIIADAQPGLAHLKEVVGYSPKAMSKYSPESPLSNWVADMMLVQGRKYSGRKIDVSFANYGGVRVDMPEGDVTVEDIRSMFPFKNNLVIVELTGERLLQVLDSLVINKSWQIVGGMQVVIGDGHVESLKIGGKPVKPCRKYTLATNTFLLNGGDNVNLAYNALSVKDTGVDIYDVVMDYLKDLRASGRDVSAVADGRVIIRNAPEHRDPGKPRGRHKVGKDFTGAQKRLTIVHTNDLHSHIEPIRTGVNAGQCGALERACYLDSLRKADGADHVLLLDAGDYEQGTPYFSIFGGKVEFELMNAMGYDAVTLGNHELDNGTDDLAKRLTWARFPVVLSNYRIDHEGVAAGIKPYTIIERGGLKIGILGMVTNLAPVVDKNNNRGMTYMHPAAPITELATKLKNEDHCDLVIVLSHCGYDEPYEDNPGDKQVAAQVRNVDIIVGGHSHTNLNAPAYVNDLDGRPVMIVQDYCWGIYAGNIIL